MIENLHQQLEATDQPKKPAPDPTHAGNFGHINSWSIDRSEIEITDHQLGVGSWATVRIALFRGLKVAAKQMHNIILTPYNNRLFAREMNIAASIRHPNLVQFIGAATEGSPIILTELMETSLRAVLQETDPSKALSKRQELLICGDTAKALNYLHLTKPHAIIHRDVGSANILLERLADEKWRAKLSDYGSVNFMQMVATRAPGCVTYAAPESLNPAMQSPKMDVFSYGVLMIEIFSCQFPAPDHREELIKGLQSNHQYAEVVALINQCISIDPQARPDMIDILAHLNND
jgi:serine/threonine protein kinase